MKPEFKIEMIPIETMMAHPGNYKTHPDDQIPHIRESIKETGIYKNIVTAEDLTILAGHGVLQASKAEGLTHVPVRRLPIAADSKLAKKVMTGDNEIAKLALVDDRMLSEMLKIIAKDSPNDLLGTGFDQMMLANLVFVTRHEHEIADFTAAAEWVGMPNYQEVDPTKNPIIEISFKNNEDRDLFVEKFGIKIKLKREGRKWSTTWPYTDRNDLQSIRFEDEKK